MSAGSLSLTLRVASIILLFLFACVVQAQTTEDPTTGFISPAPTLPTSPIDIPPPPSGTPGTPGTPRPSATPRPSVGGQDGPPDVLLQVPELSVERIELNVDNLRANLNLNAKIASLVSINAGVAVSVEKVNITIADVAAQVELQVRLGHLVDIVNRVFESLDLNPLLISTIGNVTDLVGDVIGVVDGLLGSITQGGNVLNFLVDNLGNIVQSLTDTAGKVTNTIVGDYLTNMTDTGAVKNIGQGLTQKTFQYSPLNALVNIVFNTAGQIVQAAVMKSSGGGGGGGSATPTATGTPPPASSAASTPTLI